MYQAIVAVQFEVDSKDDVRAMKDKIDQIVRDAQLDDDPDRDVHNVQVSITNCRKMKAAADD